MMPLLAVAALAIVAEDGSALRAAPSDAAPLQAQLFRGDWLEVRGEEAGFLKVWHHRRDRPGYVRAWRVRTHDLTPEGSRDLLTIALFLRDTPGMESLGIGYGALYLKAAPLLGAQSAVFDAIGTMAERLARRASARRQSPADGPVADHMEVAAAYGIRFLSREQDGRVLVTYDGEAFRHVLSTSHDPAERARAALALTRDDGSAAEAGAVATRLWNDWRLEVLGKAPKAGLPLWLSGRLSLRHAEAAALSAHQRMAAGDPAAASARAGDALHELLITDRKVLLPEDAGAYDRAALQVGAVRWAASTQSAAKGPGAKVTASVLLRPEGGASLAVAGPGTGPAFAHATASVIWPASLRVSPDGATIVAAASPTPTWTELLILRRGGPTGWTPLALPPAASDPGIGYVEPVGFSPDGKRLLLVREAIVEGKLARSFEVLRVSDLAVEHRAPAATQLTAFRKWAGAGWRGETLSMR